MIVDKEMWPMPSYGDLMFEGLTLVDKKSPLLKRWDELLKRNTTAVAGGEKSVSSTDMRAESQSNYFRHVRLRENTDCELKQSADDPLNCKIL